MSSFMYNAGVDRYSSAAIQTVRVKIDVIRQYRMLSFLTRTYYYRYDDDE